MQLLVDVGQADKARPVIAAAEGVLKGDKAAITLATCWDLVNEAEKAQAKYEEAAKASPQNSRVLRQVAAFYMNNKKPDRAESLLKQIISLQSPATLTDVCWARRNLALILKSRGDFDHFRQGMALDRREPPEQGRVRSKTSVPRSFSSSSTPERKKSAMPSRPWKNW